MPRKKAVDTLTRKQRRMLAQYLPGEVYRNLIEFILLTGLRRSELAELTWKNYDARRGIIA